MTLSVASESREAPPARALLIHDYIASLDLPVGRLSLGDLERVVSAIAWRTSETVSSVIVGPPGWMVEVSKGMGMLLDS